MTGSARKTNETVAPNPRRIWAFRFVAVCIGIAPVACLEFALRWRDGDALSPQPPPRLFVRSDDGDADPMVDHVRWEVDPRHSNHFYQDSFTDPKPANTKRVFVIGGSTVAGRPYSSETAFSTWLELQLQHAESNLNFDVINCGGVSYGTSRLLPIVQEISRYQPDVVIVYTGHNEFLEHNEVHSPPLWQPRLLSLLPSNVPSMDSQASGPQASNDTSLFVLRTRLDEHGGLDRYQRNRAERQRVESRFRRQLTQMVRVIQQTGACCILCTPISDIQRTPPFRSLPDPEQSQAEQDAVAQAWQTIQSQPVTPERRLTLAEQILQTDPEHAGAHFTVAQLRETQSTFVNPSGQRRLPISGELEHLIAARDHDVCPLRANSRIQEIVRRVATQSGAILHETCAAFRGRLELPNPRGPIPAKWFADHVHPTVAGHQVIGNALAQHFVTQGWIRRTDETRQNAKAAIRNRMASLDESYYQRGRQRLEGLRRWASGRAALPLE